MKTIIKIVIALIVLVALFNGARAVFNDYVFSEAVHEAVLFDPRATDAEIVEKVMKLAAEYDIPIEASGVEVRTSPSGMDLIVDMSYTQTINLVPGVFSRDWTFTPSTSVRLLNKR